MSEKTAIYCSQCETACADGQAACPTCGHALAAPPEPPSPPATTPPPMTLEERGRAIDVQRRWNAWDAERRRRASILREIDLTRGTGYSLRVVGVLLGVIGIFGGVAAQELDLFVGGLLCGLSFAAFAQILIGGAYAWEAFESEYRERHPLGKEPDKPEVLQRPDPWAWLDTKLGG